MKPSVGLVIFATVMAFCIIMDGVVAPFPRDDPRSILNPLILPWWNVAPLHVKQIAHLIGTGKPLPAEQAVPRRRVNRPWKVNVQMLPQKIFQPYFFALNCFCWLCWTTEIEAVKGLCKKSRYMWDIIKLARLGHSISTYWTCKSRCRKGFVCCSFDKTCGSVKCGLIHTYVPPIL